MGLFDDPNAIDWGQLANGMATPGMDPTFAQRFQGGGPPPVMPPMPPPMPTGPTPAQSPISPEALAATAAARGIPPPAQDASVNPGDSMRMPDAGAVEDWRRSSGPGGEVGAALTGNSPGAPTDITSQAQKSSMATPMKKEEDKMGDFAKALRGVKAPADPVMQKISSPNAPRPTTQIKGGDIMALLQALNAAPGAGGLKLPSTLGEAIRK